MPLQRCEWGRANGGYPCEQVAVISLWLKDQEQEVWLCVEHAGIVVEQRRKGTTNLLTVQKETDIQFLSPEEAHGILDRLIELAKEKK